MASPPYLTDFEDILEEHAVKFGCVPAGDGYPLHTYEFGESSENRFVLVGAVATSALLMIKLASWLGEGAHCLCYEHRGSPYLGDSEADRAISVQEYARDLKNILASKGMGHPHVIGHCSSASVISWAVANGELDASSVTLLAPTGIGVVSEKLYTQEVFFPMLMKVAGQSDDDARNTVQTVQNLAGIGHEERVKDTEVQRITLLNIRDFPSARRYAHLLCGVDIEPDESRRLFDEMCRKVPVLVLHACDDQVTSYTGSVDALKRSSQEGLKLTLYASGTHFIPFTRAQRVARDVMEFSSAYG
jgi:fermentation-respiration switch protein FrsA (DUF1100 family)